MSGEMKAFVAITALALTPWPEIAAAQVPGRLAPLAACRAITQDAARLACFDRESAALAQAAQGGEIAVVDRDELRRTRRGLFGFSVPSLPFFAGDRSASDQPEQIESRLTSVVPIGRNRYRMRIAEGNAVWENIEGPSRLETPAVGQPIVIKKGAMGSYFLRINGQIGVKGIRVK